MNIKGAIFDFDGTLFDSMHLWKGLRFRFFEHIGLSLTEEEKKELEGIYIRESLIFVKEKFNLKESYDELLDQFFDYLKALYLDAAAPKNDIIDFLEKLKSKGVKMGIATASRESAVEAALKKFDMLDYFEAIYSTYTVGVAKTESKVYDTVLEVLGTEKDTTWVFEDALYAAKTAKENGYHLVGIYDKSEKNVAKLQQLADIYIHNYSEIEL